jgi:predicted outer membrane repeat protein
VSANGQPRNNTGKGHVIVAAVLVAIVGLAMPFEVSQTAAAEASPPVVLAVDTFADDPSKSACLDATPSDCSLRGALVNANADGATEIETISIPAGTFDLTVAGDGNEAGSLNVTASVIIAGAGPGQTIIDANGLDRVLVVNGGGPVPERTLVASGITFRGGAPCNQLGGGDDNGNTAGGGLMIHGLATLTDVVVENNATCNTGGGVWATQYGSVLTMVRTVVRNNTSQGSGAGIQSDYSLTLTDSTVSGNVSQWRGGGLVLAGTAVISGTTISNNSAVGRGGGIHTGDDTTSACCAATVTITNSTISGNIARHWNSGTPQYFPGVGGGILIGRSSFTLRHVTVTGNISETNPNYGALGLAGGIAAGYTNFLTLENSIVAGNFATAECSLDGTTFSATGSIGCSTGGLDTIALGSLASNGGPTQTHALAEGSAALDGGSSAVCQPVDQRGEPRPSGTGCDIGAYELQVGPPPPPPPPPPAPPADAVVAITSTYSLPLGQMTDPFDHFRFSVTDHGGTSLATFTGDDLFGPGGPTEYLVGVAVSDTVHGERVTVAEDVPARWLPIFGGDCAADGSLVIHAGELRTCTVENVHLDELEADPTAALVVETSFRTPPAVALSSFDLVVGANGDPEVFDTDAGNLGPSGRWSLGFAIPAGDTAAITLATHRPAGWLAILSGDCAANGSVSLAPGERATCRLEWIDVGTPADAVVIVTSSYSVPTFQIEDPLRDFRFEVTGHGGTSLATFDGDDLAGGSSGYVLGVVVSDTVHGEPVTVAETVPQGWLPIFGGDCGADGTLAVRAGQLKTCSVSNVRLDAFEPAPTSALQLEVVFRTAPAVALTAFDIVVGLNGDANAFDFDASEAGPDGRWALGIAVPAGDEATLDVATFRPAGWLAVIGGDCAADGSLTLPAAASASCRIEFVEVGTPADAVVAITSTYSLPLGQMTDPFDHFRFSVTDHGGTSLATFTGDDLFGPGGPTEYLVGVAVSDTVHGERVTVAEDVPARWLPIFGGDCAADGSLVIHAGELRTCTVENVHLDELEADPTAALVVETSFRTPPAVALSSFDLVVGANGDPEVFDTDAGNLGPSGRWSLGFAIPAGDTAAITLATHRPAGWLAILSGDCAANGSVSLAPGERATCRLEWIDVGTPPDPIVDLVIDDCSAASLATVTAVTGNLVVTDATCPSLSLPNLTAVSGDLVVIDNGTLTELSLPGLDRIEGSLVVTGNASLLDVDLSSLSFVGGDLIVTQNTAVESVASSAAAIGGDFDVSANATLTVITMPDVETVGGDMTMTGNPTLTTIDMSGVVTVGGDMTMTGNPTLTTIEMPAVESIAGDMEVSANTTLTDVSAPTLTVLGGDMTMSSNPTLTTIDMPALTNVTGDMTMTSNPTLTTIDMPAVTNVTGDMEISGNASLTTFGTGLVLHLPGLVTVGGSIVISDNVQLVTVEAPAITDIGGDMTLTSNPTLTTLDMPAVETIGGDMTMTANPTLTVFTAPVLETVEGDMTLELQAATIDLATISVGGDSTIVGTATEMLVAETALGSTSFQLLNGLATLETTLAAGTFAANVGFTIEQVTGAELAADGAIDPLVAYHFDFEVPTLGIDAAVTFTIDLDELSAADRQALLEALSDGRATLAVRADGGGSYETLSICAIGQTPAADACVSVGIDGAEVSFSGVAGHFSTWAVVVVAAPDVAAPIVSVPADKVLEATGPSGRSVTYGAEVSASDARDGTVSTACSPPSGSTFPIGTTTVTCRAQDSAGNEGSASFRIVIVDTTGPAISVPSTVSSPATGPAGAIVTFSVSATDLVSGPATVVCTPASGSTFAIGQTTVTCRATDASANQASRTFIVRVLGATDQLTLLRDDVAAATPPLSQKLVNDLKGKLNDAIQKLAIGKKADACKKIQEFIVKVTDESIRRTIPSALAASWIDRARQVRTVLGC